MSWIRLFVLTSALLAGCSSTQPMTEVELHGSDATRAIKGVQNPGNIYVDILPDGTLVLHDRVVSREQFRQEVVGLPNQGIRKLTVRIAKQSPGEVLYFVQRTSNEAGIETLAIVRFDPAQYRLHLDG